MFQAALSKLSKALPANWRTRPKSKPSAGLRFLSCHLHQHMYGACGPTSEHSDAVLSLTSGNSFLDNHLLVVTKDLPLFLTPLKAHS